MISRFFQRVSFYVRLWVIQFRLNWAREVMYRQNYLTAFFVDIVWIALEYVFFGVLYSHVDSIGGWTKYQVYFFLGLLFSGDALFSIFFSRNFWMFSDLINKGELDIFLTKPAQPIFLILTRFMNLTAVSNFVMGILLMVKFSALAHFSWKERGWFVPLAWLLSLSAALVLRFIFAVSVFWTDRNWSVVRLYYQFYGVATKPEKLYPPWAQVLFRFVLPFSVITSVPARWLMEGVHGWETVGILGVLFIFLYLDITLWRRGLEIYQSASS